MRPRPTTWMMLAAALLLPGWLVLPDEAEADPAGAARAAGRPNIMLILVDDQTLGDLRVMPQLRSLLGEHGTTFDQAVAPYPLCCPMRASILTGQYPHNHGVLGNGAPSNPYGGYAAFAGQQDNTLATWLDAASYHTAFIGKYFNGYGHDEPAVVPAGWDDWQGAVGNTYTFDGIRLMRNGSAKTYGRYSTDVMARLSANVITERAARRRPFFLMTAYVAPHAGGPVEPDDPINVHGRAFPTTAVPDRYRDAFAHERLPRGPDFDEADVSDKPAPLSRRGPLSKKLKAMMREAYQQRLEAALALDDAVATQMAALAATGELENTVVIYTGDNGLMMGEHRTGQQKVLPYEPALRVPLIIRGPGFPAGATSSQPSALIDLAPTITAATGTTPARVVDGIPLQPLAQNPAAAADRDIVIEAGPRSLDTTDMFYTGVRADGWQYVEYGNGAREMYDLATDPYQLSNLADDPDHAQRQSALAARLAQLRDCAGELCSAADSAPPRA